MERPSGATEQEAHQSMSHGHQTIYCYGAGNYTAFFFCRSKKVTWCFIKNKKLPISKLQASETLGAKLTMQYVF